MLAAPPTEDVNAVQTRLSDLETALAAERALRIEWEHKHARLLGAY